MAYVMAENTTMINIPPITGNITNNPLSSSQNELYILLTVVVLYILFGDRTTVVVVIVPYILLGDNFTAAVALYDFLGVAVPYARKRGMFFTVHI